MYIPKFLNPGPLGRRGDVFSRLQDPKQYTGTMKHVAVPPPYLNHYLELTPTLNLTRRYLNPPLNPAPRTLHPTPYTPHPKPHLPNLEPEPQNPKTPASHVREHVAVIDSGRGTMGAEDAQGTPPQSYVSPSMPVYEDEHQIPLASPTTTHEPHERHITVLIPTRQPYTRGPTPSSSSL